MLILGLSLRSLYAKVAVPPPDSLVHPPPPRSHLRLRLPRISRSSPMMPDYRSLLQEEGKRLELGIRAAERQGEVSFACRSLNP